MAAATQLLTLEEFRTRYSDSDKPYFEYWFGEAVQKSVPTWLHAVLQQILCEFLRKAGYKSGSELELRIDAEWQPKADVSGLLVSPEGRYPTQPFDVVVEVLSPEDAMSRVHEKCSHYSRIGIASVFVFDPESRKAWSWSPERDNLERLRNTWSLPNGVDFPLSEIWDELERRK